MVNITQINDLFRIAADIEAETPITVGATRVGMVGKLLEPVFRTLPADVARRIVDLEADEELEQRVELLAQKANEGELTPQEREEYAACIEAGDVLATLQALARRTLEQTAVDD